jgi:hypothetical protein
MRIELILLLITAAVLYNIYTEGKFLKSLYTYKKYYQMAGVVFGALFLYYVFKKNPLQAHSMIAASNDYMKYMPLDKNTSNMISPILNFTQQQMRGGSTEQIHLGGMGAAPALAPNHHQISRIMKSGDNKPTKRSVSETKKKFVAAQQNWRCGKCQKQLPAWFEVDHKTRLEYGGSNHIDNLVALCRDCHGEKTAIENL